MTIEIASRFRGPPQSGNGGYVCGLLGGRFDGPATVRLLAPPPLERPLRLVREDSAWMLYDGEAPIARAREAELDLAVPQSPSREQAEAAARSFVGFRSHPFPGCFVCGPERRHGDGLCIFPGRLEAEGHVAAPWTPDASLADADGRVDDTYLWSALDCTGFFAFAPLPDGAPALLGELSARIDGEASAGEPLIVTGWRIGSEGRKRFAGSAIHRSDGTPIARARATWIVMPPGAAGAN